MRHLDLGTVASDKPAPSRSRKPVKSRRTSKKGNPFKTIAGLFLLGLLVFALYSFLPPIKETLAGMFNNASVFSYLAKTTNQQLKQDSGKTNILLIGIDRREDEPYSYQGANGQTRYSQFRSDTIIVASYNHDSQRITMLSLPRDLWVTIPSFGQVQSYNAKINAVYGTGDVYEYPGGGQALLSKVVSDIIGMPIHYTARIDFSGFEKAIDAVGGVEVNVQNSFTDYSYPIEGREDALPVSSRYKTVTFKKGPQTMNGQKALEFSRSRHAAGAEGTDFARAKRQQLVIDAFRQKVLSSNTLLNPGTISKLLGTLNESFSATLNPLEYPAAIAAIQEAQDQSMASYNLDDRTDHPGGILYAPPVGLAKYAGAYVLIPQEGPQQIRQFAAQIFSAQGYQEATPSATPKSP